MPIDLNYDNLKKQHRAIRDTLVESLSLRIHRSLSWLNRSEKIDEDNDAQFIFLWIAFNAAYANEIYETKSFSERRIQMNFIKKLIKSDKENLLYNLLWKEFNKSIRILIDNQYVYQPFWDFQKGIVTKDDWERRFKEDKGIANKALARMNTSKVLAIVLDRLYVLRNQLMHGAATWNGKVNRDQIRDGANIMRHLVPTIIHIMLETDDKLWGEAAYPVVDH